jgi:penicillin-binding protein 1C
MRGVSGVTGAAPVLHDLVEHLHARFGTTAFAARTGVVERLIDPLTGHGVAATAPGARREWCRASALPPEASVDNYDAAGRAILPGEYHDWFAAGRNPLADRVVVTAEPDSRSGAPHLRVLGPVAGTVFFLDPDLPQAGGRVRLRANTTRPVAWSSPTLEVETKGGEAFARLREGRHELVVRDAGHQTEARTWIEVKRL